MKAALRRHLPGEPDPELLALGASGATLGCGFAWVAARLPLPPCAFHAITGCPCPTCGATRCLLALLHGRTAEALAWNPLLFTALAVLALFNLYAVAVLLARLPRLRLSLHPPDLRFLRIACALLLAANWAYEIHHGV